MPVPPRALSPGAINGFPRRVMTRSHIGQSVVLVKLARGRHWLSISYGWVVMVEHAYGEKVQSKFHTL